MVVCAVFVAPTLFAGIFHNSCCHKPIRISLASKKFIQEVLPLEKALAVGQGNQIDFISWTDKIKDQEFFVKADIEKLQRILQAEKQALFNSISSSPRACDMSDEALVKTDCLRVQQSNGLKKLLKILSQKLSGLNARGFEKDVIAIKSFIDSLENKINFIGSSRDAQTKALGLLTIIINIVSSFDGVFVNDYDVFVLASTAQAIFLAACEI